MELRSVLENLQKSRANDPLIWAPGVVILVLGVTLLLYRVGLSGFFVVDDAANIKPMYITSFSWEGLAAATFGNSSGELGRPVSTLSLVLSAYFSDLDPAVIKLHNLIIHLVTGVLLMWLGFLVLRQLLGRERERQILVTAICAGTVWLVHPLLVSTVLYAVQRMAQLSTLFMVAALISYMIGRGRLLEEKTKGPLIIAAGVSLFGLLSVFSKENGALLPLYILLLEALVFQFRTPTQATKKQLQQLLGVFVVLPLVLGVLFVFYALGTWVAGYSSKDFTMLERLYTQTQLMFHYLSSIVTPRLNELGIYQDGFPIVRSFDIKTGMAALLLAAAVAGAWECRKRAPVLSLGIYWFLIGHLMESTIIPLEMAFEHRNYLPSFGILFAISYYLLKPYPGKESLHKYQWLLFACVTAVLAATTHARAVVWSDYKRLVVKSYEYSPGSQWATADMASLQISLGATGPARYTLSKAYAEFPPMRAGIVLQQMWTYCRGGTAMPESLLQEARRELAVTKPTLYVRNGMMGLEKLMTEGFCPELTMDQYLLLVEAMLDNRRLPAGGRERQNYRMLQAKSLMLSGRYGEGLAVYDTIYESARQSGSRRWAFEGLYTKIYWQIKAGDYRGAEEGLALLTRLHEESPLGYGEKLATVARVLAREKARAGSGPAAK